MSERATDPLPATGTEALGPSPIRFGPDGLIPVVVQDADGGDVLMVGFMNEAALAATRVTGRTHFWSRSRERLWRKGERSGYEQVIEAIFVNCEQNSLLLRVRQIGAVCHDGYPTCYYRRLEPDGSLTTVRDRSFDPQDVYAATSSPGGAAPAAAPPDPLAAATRLLYGAFAFLRDHDLTAVSGTSGRLRATEDGIGPRVADELGELAGTLDGSHRHRGMTEDALLEGTQVLYWVVLSALRARLGWDDVRPDRALATHEAGLDTGTAAQLLRAEARRWASGAGSGSDRAAFCHATLALVGQACQVAGVGPLALVEAEVAALREKPYLDSYFGDVAARGAGRGEP